MLLQAANRIMIAKQKKQKAFFGFSKNLRSCIITTPRIDSLRHSFRMASVCSISLCVQMRIVYDQSIIDNRLFNLKISNSSISVNIWYYTFFCKIYSNIVQDLMRVYRLLTYKCHSVQTISIPYGFSLKIHGRIAKTEKSK